jgi:hypothetical protein
MKSNSSTDLGFVLITALILLVMLTLVAITAMRNSGLEILMSENQIQRTEAFENTEYPRQAFGELVDQHTLARGWPIEKYGSVPRAYGGSVPQSVFRFDWPIGIDLIDESSPDHWFVRNIECIDENPCALPPTADLEVKASFGNAESNALTAGRAVAANLRVFKLRTDIASGAGAAMVSGYEGVGRAAAAGGGQVFFHLESESVSTRQSMGEGRASTAATYRHVIRN